MESVVKGMGWLVFFLQDEIVPPFAHGAVLDRSIYYIWSILSMRYMRRILYS